MATMTALRLKTEVDINPTTETAEFSIWYANEAEAYTVRVRPLSDEDREQYARTHVLSDGYGEDYHYNGFDTAVSAAWDVYEATQEQHFDTARGIEGA